ncbi:MAG: hypothetical protein RLZ44_982, partial [Pseudomonadota bacterium]
MRPLILVAGLLLAATSAVASGGSAQECGVEAKPCVQYGARVFQERCSLCHGSDGLGEGILALSLKDYPNTNLLEPKHTKDIETLTRVVTYGGGLPEVSTEMPPWGDELTATQLESVVQFVDFMRRDLERSLELLKVAAASMQPSTRVGRAVYQGRCALCHGKYGQGDGKMARIIKSPPPFNLTLSRAPDDYLHDIIYKGGEKMGRSPRMPPWGGDLS